ncbi:MAG TPA: hypothetical protein VLA09_08690 [Longimicrobiales bacterium]|nr:hypothetical protein [Longimicrobiales bacterium]
MTMVDWLLTEQLVEIFREEKAKRPDLNAELLARSPHGEEDVLAGAGTAVRVDATDGSVYLLTPRRLARIVDGQAYTMLTLSELVGYDWISPQVSEKVALKDAHFDRLYLYPRDAPPIVLDHLGRAVYPMLTFFGRVLEYQSQKVLLPRLGREAVETLGRCLVAAASGPFFLDEELRPLFGRNRESMQVVAAMWPRMNLAAPDLHVLLDRVVRELIGRFNAESPAWQEWIGIAPDRLESSADTVRSVLQASPER